MVNSPVPCLQERRLFHRRLYESWKNKLGRYRSALDRDSCGGSRQTALQAIRLKTIKLYEQGVLITLNIDPLKGNLACDDLSKNFERIIELTEDLIDNSKRLSATEEYSVQVLMSMVPMISDFIQSTGSLVRGHALRNRAVKIIRAHEYQSGFFLAARLSLGCWKPELKLSRRAGLRLLLKGAVTVNQKPSYAAFTE